MTIEPNDPPTQAKVRGIGGIFFKARNPQAMGTWYAEFFGFPIEDGHTLFHWRNANTPEKSGLTVWAIMPDDTTYFNPGSAPFMVNYIVDDIDGMLQRLQRAGVRIDAKREDTDYGRFAWVYDPEGNKIELWEPPADG